MTEPWKPDSIPGIEQAPHYVETEQPRSYAGQRVFIIGKRNSGFELADGLLPWARQIILASPRPAKLSILTNSVAGARARYLQPYEDHVLGGGTFVLDASIERIERSGGGFWVAAKGTSTPGDRVFEVDRVIAATGFGTCAAFERLLRPVRQFPENVRADYLAGDIYNKMVRFVSDSRRKAAARHWGSRQDGALRAARSQFVALGGDAGYATFFAFGHSLRG
jgi:thioredoxin reductase